MDIYRFDLGFSYWVFIWYLLYIFEIVDASPKLALTVGLVENAFLLFAMVFLSPIDIQMIFLFILSNFITKAIPAYTLRDESIDIENDSINTMVVFIIHIAWLIYLRKNVVESVYSTNTSSYESTPARQLMLDVWKRVYRPRRP